MLKAALGINLASAARLLGSHGGINQPLRGSGNQSSASGGIVARSIAASA